MNQLNIMIEKSYRDNDDCNDNDLKGEVKIMSELFNRITIPSNA